MLEVSPEASDDELRRAYRALARRHHPDRSGIADSTDMARINAAYAVLGTPHRRAVYDERRRASPAAGATNGATPARTAAVSVRPPQRARVGTEGSQLAAVPARFPWQLVSVLAGIGIGCAFAFAALNQPAVDVPVHDQLIEAGSCVFVQGTGRVVEVTCGSTESREVVAVVSPQESCSPGLLRYRTIDPQTHACVERAR